MKNKKIEIDPSNIPRHIGFIMDGNGRWATRRGLPRTAGHSAGVDALTRVVEACREYGVEAVSLYAFSTENFNRSDSECSFIFNLIKKFVKKKLPDLIKNDVRLIVSGDLSYSPKLDEETKVALLEAVEQTKTCRKHVLNLCFCYGGRHEIVEAVNKLLSEGKTKISEEDIQKNLYTASIPDPDLIVRASGEQRLSNFLMWQSAYSELLFVDDFWPDFNKQTVEYCISEYQKRNRRFGKV